MLTRTPAGKPLVQLSAVVAPLLRREGEIVISDADFSPNP
jgi:hypothetical protein